MTSLSHKELDALWSRHNAEWRDSAQIASQWQEAAETDPRLLEYTVAGTWWAVLERAGITILVTREYEHLVMALCVDDGYPTISYMPMPHPSGLVVSRTQGTVYVASTRNPNQIYDFLPTLGLVPRLDVEPVRTKGHPLLPIRSRFYPGCLYIHDLALIGGDLYANAVGHNAVVRLRDGGGYERVWWPRCIETESGPVFGQNHIQLNSIAAGANLEESCFSASAARLSSRRPGHADFPVDKQGVLFSGRTREPIVYNLTRPHSARWHSEQVWLDNSGYGELCLIENGDCIPVVRLPGWTRGLCFYDRIAFVGTSRVIPRFRQYAPGLDIDSSVCGVHAVDIESGLVLGSLVWPYGNQVFALDWMPSQTSLGFPFPVGEKRSMVREKTLFYTFKTHTQGQAANGQRAPITNAQCNV